MNLIYRLLLLGPLLACGPLTAAQAPAAEDEAQEEPAAEQGGEESAAADNAEQGEAEPTDAEEAEGEGALVLEDENFVPSVQISEDLSVSFPVDI